MPRHHCALVCIVLAVTAVIGCRGSEQRPPQPEPAQVARQADATQPARASRLADAATATATAKQPSERRVWPPPSPAGIVTDWCIDSVSALDEATCYVLPDTPPRDLLIYLHGIVPPTRESLQKTKFETVVANAARRAGIAALMPRGKQGFARDKWWGWPTAEPAYSQHAPAMVDVIGEKRRKLEELTGLRFTHMYVAGSSSGGYFAAMLALRGTIEADGFGAMSGGAGHRTGELAHLPPKPFYIGYGAHDSVRGSSRALGELLRSAGWPVKVAEHPLGHGAQEVYLDEAFAFWREHADARAR